MLSVRFSAAPLHAWLMACLLFTPFLFQSISFAAPPAQKTKLYFFWGDGCPHCEKEKGYLADLSKKHPELEVMSYEVWRNPQNAALFKEMRDVYGLQGGSVPVTIIGRNVFVGFSEGTADGILKTVQICKDIGCPEPGKKGVELKTTPKKEDAVQRTESVTLPLFGRLDAERTSLPLLAIILGGMDSFNPCAFFVLLFLLSFMLNSGSRSRMLLIGGIFVSISGIVYFLFMAAWLNLFIITGRVGLITAVAGAVALLIGAVNVKDFFFLGEGVSLSISHDAKLRLYDRMRGILRSTSTPSMIGGTILLAFAANTYELLCTAGFPMVFTRVLTLNNLTPAQYYAYLALYNFVYIIPMAVIVALFAVTLGARKLSEREGRILKLLSGTMMFGMGAVLLIKPALMNSLAAAISLMAGSISMTWILLKVTEKKKSK